MSFSYVLNESLAGFWRTRTNSLITIFTVSISLLLLGIFYLVTQSFNNLMDMIKAGVEMEVFLREDIGDITAEKIGQSLVRIPGVGSVEFVSKERALKIFAEEFGESFTDLLTTNPLPPSYKVRLDQEYLHPDSVAGLTRAISRISGVESIVYRKEYIELLGNRLSTLKTFTLVIGIVLALCAVILVANTIRLTIYARREIIRTMKLVGATRSFIRRPFIIEGILHGVLGGIIASALIEFIFVYFLEPILTDLHLELRPVLLFYLELIFLGGFLGWLGSVTSIRRFLSESLITAPGQ